MLLFYCFSNENFGVTKWDVITKYKMKIQLFAVKTKKALIKLAVVGPIRGKGALTGETGFYNYHQGGDNYGS